MKRAPLARAKRVAGPGGTEGPLREGGRERGGQASNPIFERRYSALQLRRSPGRGKQVGRSATKSCDPREKPERSSDGCSGKGTFARSRQLRARAKVPSVHPMDERCNAGVSRACTAAMRQVRLAALLLCLSLAS